MFADLHFQPLLDGMIYRLLAHELRVGIGKSTDYDRCDSWEDTGAEMFAERLQVSHNRAITGHGSGQLRRPSPTQFHIGVSPDGIATRLSWQWL